LITHNTIGPLARGTSVLDVMKNMVLSGSTYALLEGAPLLLIDAEQILRRIALCDSAVEVLEVLRSDTEELAYEVTVVDKEEDAVKAILGKEIGAVVLKGGSLVDSLYLLAENKDKLEEHKVEEVMDSRPPLVDPLIDVIRALRQSLVYSLSGHIIVGQKRPFGIITPLKALRYFTMESTLSQIEMGESAPLERAAGDLAEPLSTYPSTDTKLSDALQTMIEHKSEVLPVVKEKKYLGVLKARTMLLPLIR